MTQPAKVQEPSMEEILASIRRIIADDEAKPPAAEKAAAPEPAKAEKPAAPAPKPVMNDVPPSKIAAAAPAKAVTPPAPAPAPVRPAAEPLQAAGRPWPAFNLLEWGRRPRGMPGGRAVGAEEPAGA